MILITVPHAAAGNGQDAGALRFLVELEAVLTDVGEDYQIIEGEVSREILDLNRKEASQSDFAPTRMMLSNKQVCTLTCTPTPK